MRTTSLSMFILVLFFLSSSLLFHPSPCRLRSIFLPIPFSFSLTFRRMCSIFSLSSRHLLHLLSLFSFLPIPVLSLLVPTSATRYHFPLSHTLSPPYCTSILLFSLFSLTFLCLCPSTFLFTFSLYIFSPSRLLILSFF
jgi:hypothetical protein